MATAGHLSTCPRMLKAADALAAAGYDVRVVSARYMDWAWEADQKLRRTRPWKWTVVSYDRHSTASKYLRSGIRFRSAQALARALGPARCPLAVAARAYGRAHDELLQAIAAEPADLIYAGTSGALAAAALASRRTGAPYALDLEDFHSAEHGGHAAGRLLDHLGDRIERSVLPRAAFVTAGSAAIAHAYSQERGIRAIPLHNTFPIPDVEPDLGSRHGGSLRLYWFGQTVGQGRGLETVVEGVGRARIECELHLRGTPAAGYAEALGRLAAQAAAGLKIYWHAPAAPDCMIDLCRDYDLGLAVEPGASGNNRMALSNKALTYILAGLAVAITDTPGQQALARDLGEGALVYRPDDSEALAAGLQRWADDRSLLARAKAKAWAAARNRWHWEHRQERGALLQAVAAVFAS